MHLKDKGIQISFYSVRRRFIAVVCEARRTVKEIFFIQNNERKTIQVGIKVNRSCKIPGKKDSLIESMKAISLCRKEKSIRSKIIRREDL